MERKKFLGTNNERMSERFRSNKAREIEICVLMLGCGD